MAFAERAIDALADARLRGALDRVTGALGSRRESAFASLDHAEFLRLRAEPRGEPLSNEASEVASDSLEIREIRDSDP